MVFCIMKGFPITEASFSDNEGLMMTKGGTSHTVLNVI